MGSIGVQNQLIQPAPEVINPQQDEFWHTLHDDARRYKGTIYAGDVQDYGEKYALPAGEVQMIKIGEWIGDGGRKIGSWVFADGSHANLQFSRDERGRFFLETID